MKQTERRFEGRYLCADVVHVSRIIGDRIRTIEAVLEDISPLGACVQVEEDIPLGSEVVLMAGDKGLGGVISYSVYRDYGFFAGIHFQDEAHWSSGIFVPDHLTNLQSLANQASE
jgi:hypothetical protein